jgi:uncharacterized protein with ATP-grasp and redox domains
LSEATAALQSELKDVRKFYIVLDALDESNEVTRAQVLKELKKLEPKLRLLVTGRPYANDVECLFKAHQTLPIRTQDRDVEKFIQCQIELPGTLQRKIAQNPDLRKLVLDVVVSKAQGM